MNNSRILLIASILVLSHASRGNIPPPPDPEEACLFLREGAHCTAFAGIEGWVEGICVKVSDGLICQDQNKQKNVSDPLSGQHVAPKTAGCNGLGTSPSLLVSLLSILSGLFVFSRFRKR